MEEKNNTLCANCGKELGEKCVQSEVEEFKFYCSVNCQQIGDEKAMICPHCNEPVTNANVNSHWECFKKTMQFDPKEFQEDEEGIWFQITGLKKMVPWWDGIWVLADAISDAEGHQKGSSSVEFSAETHWIPLYQLLKVWLNSAYVEGMTNPNATDDERLEYLVDKAKELTEKVRDELILKVK